MAAHIAIAVLFVAFTTIADALGVWLVVRQLTRPNLIGALTHFAVGTLLAFAFLDLLPEALEGADMRAVLATTLLGVVGFYLVERLVGWQQCHDAECEVHQAGSPAKKIIVFAGASLEEFIDGAAIGLTVVLAGGSLGLPALTSLAVFAHEFPDSVSRTIAFINAGTAPSHAMRQVMLTALSSFVGALLAVLVASAFAPLLPYLTALAAAAFIYIASSHIIPELQHGTVRGLLWMEVLAMAAGVGLIAVLGIFE